MFHSITFYDLNQKVGIDEGKNTYTDFHLIPSTSMPRPVIDPPSVKTTTVDIPGADSFIDLSESLTKYPVYNNRQGSIEFIVLSGFEEWTTLYSRIASYLHGRKKRAVLDDDPGYFYEGRFKVNKWKSNNDGTWSNITIDYDVQPYKYAVTDSTDDWLWDPFNFKDGIIMSDFFTNITVDSDEYVYRTLNIGLGRKPISPEIIVYTTDSTGMSIQLFNPELDITSEFLFSDGISFNSDFILSNISGWNEVRLGFKGHGTVSMKFRNGEL